MEERKTIIQWVKGHKKQLIISGISIGSLILIIVGIKNRETINAVWDSLRGVVKNTTEKVAGNTANMVTEIPQVQDLEDDTSIAFNSVTIPFCVSSHIRNLPEGWHPSPEKVAEALKNNIVLMNDQTWVEGYMKGCAAA